MTALGPGRTKWTKGVEVGGLRPVRIGGRLMREAAKDFFLDACREGWQAPPLAGPHGASNMSTERRAPPLVVGQRRWDRGAM